LLPFYFLSAKIQKIMIQAKEYPEKNNEIAKYHICGIADKEKK